VDISLLEKLNLNLSKIRIQVVDRGSYLSGGKTTGARAGADDMDCHRHIVGSIEGFRSCRHRIAAGFDLLNLGEVCRSVEHKSARIIGRKRLVVNVGVDHMLILRGIKGNRANEPDRQCQSHQDRRDPHAP